jgi:hypothetical protein
VKGGIGPTTSPFVGLNVNVEVSDPVDGINLPVRIFLFFFVKLNFSDSPKPVNTKPSGLMGPKGEPLPLMGVNVRAKMVRGMR